MGYDDVIDGGVLTANINALTYLDVSNKNIGDLTGIADFVSLTELRCNNNQLQSLNVSTNTALTILRCHFNQLANLDVSANTALMGLACNNNLLTSLDISANSNLTILACQNNQLISLNVKNGNNTNFTYFKAQNNSSLTCIMVDDATWSTINWTNIDASASFSENCSVVNYSLTVNVTGNGTVSPNSGTYNQGDMVNIIATPDTGWQFAGWSGDASGMSNPLSITMDADKNITATFTQIQQTLTVNVTGNGTVSPNSGSYNQDDIVNITATPATGWQFAGWSGDASGMSNPLSITMDADKVITATFTQIQQILTVNVIGNGTVSPNSGTYNQGDVVNITATPDTGWQFAGWSGDASGMSNPLSVTMDADKVITATFTTTASTDDSMISSKISIYPNPAKNTINIQNESNYPITKIALYDMFGKLVYQSNTLKQIQTNNLSNGLYIIKISSNNKTVNKKIVISK